LLRVSDRTIPVIVGEFIFECCSDSAFCASSTVVGDAMAKVSGFFKLSVLSIVIAVSVAFWLCLLWMAIISAICA